MTVHAPRNLAVLVLAAFLAACTHQVARPPVEVRHYRVDWSQVEGPPLRLDGLTAQSIVLTPAQWPLEASVKKLLHADFIGVVEALDLRFRSANLPEGVLRDLFDEGYLAAYVRVQNGTTEPQYFLPTHLAVAADEDVTLPAVAPEDLPTMLEEVDWERVAAGVLVAVLVILIVAAASDRNSNPDLARIPARIIVETSSPDDREQAQAPPPEAAYGPGGEPGILQPGELAPGEAREGFVFFLLTDPVADWRTARLAAW